MRIETITARKNRILVAGAFALLAQGAWADESRDAERAPPEVKVSIPDQRIEIAAPKIETNTQAQIEALNRRIARDFRKILDDGMAVARIELAIAEVPTRG